MRGAQGSLGVIGLVLLFFGAAAFALTREVGLFVAGNLAFGLFALIAYLASGRDTIRTFLGERSTRYGANAVLYSALFVGIIVMANVLASRYSARLDATEGSVYSLSPQSAKVVKDLTNDLELAAFVEGGKDPALQDLFENYGRESTRVKWQIVDPDKSPDLAEKYKITNYNTVRVGFGEQSTLVTKPDEESITNAIIKVTQATKKTVCFVEGHGEPDSDEVENPRGYGALKQALESENYGVQKMLLATQEKPPAECSLLVVASPVKPWLDPELALLKQYLKDGGRAAFLFSAQRGDELVPVLADYGVKVGNDVVVDQVIRLFQGPALGLDPIANTYGVHPITEGFKERTIFPLSRTVDAADGKKNGIDVTSLVKTSPSSWAESDVAGIFERSQASLDPSTDQKGPLSIAVAVKIDRKAAGGDKEGESRLVVFGSDQFANNKNLTNFYNRDLALNAIGWSVGEEKVISIRTRNIRASRVQLTADEVQRIFYLSVLVLPELLLLAGITVWARRRSA